jgi:hypothetical protein
LELFNHVFITLYILFFTSEEEFGQNMRKAAFTKTFSETAEAIVGTKEPLE